MTDPDSASPIAVSAPVVEGDPLAATLGFTARPLAEAPADWDGALAAAPSVPAAYTRALVQYQAAYVSDRATRYADLSRVLYHEGKPVGAWPLSALHDGTGWRLGSQEAPVRPPLVAASAPDTTRRRLEAACMDYVEALARDLGLAEWHGTGFFPDGNFDGWHRRAMERGATPTLLHMLAIDLGRDLEALRLNIRGSYRPLVSKGLKLWKVAVFDGTLGSPAPRETFDEYRALHRQVAGRATRSDRTWELNYEALAAGDAFLVTLRDDGARLVGGGYFYTSRTDALYAVGVYDRALFPQPLGHAVQWTAIQHMKKRGLRLYWIGQRPYAWEAPAPTEKELAIGRFKEGFATHVFPEIRLRVPVAGATPTPASAPPPRAPLDDTE